jgi:hypothetical protein
MGLFLPTQNHQGFDYFAIVLQIRRVYRHLNRVLFPELQALYFPPQFKGEEVGSAPSRVKGGAVDL